MGYIYHRIGSDLKTRQVPQILEDPWGPQGVQVGPGESAGLSGRIRPGYNGFYTSRIYPSGFYPSDIPAIVRGYIPRASAKSCLHRYIHSSNRHRRWESGSGQHTSAPEPFRRYVRLANENNNNTAVSRLPVSGLRFVLVTLRCSGSGDNNTPPGMSVNLLTNCQNMRGRGAVLFFFFLNSTTDG